MSTPWEDDEQFPGTQAPQQEERNPLRKVVNDLEKQLKEAREAAEAAQKGYRQAALGLTVRDLKLDPRVAELVPAEVGPEKEAVSAWVSKFGDLFGVPKADEPGTQTEEPQGQTAVPAEVQAQMARVQALDSQPGTSAPDGADAVRSKLTALSQSGVGFEEMLAQVRNLG